MDRQRTLLGALSDDLHCPVCLEVFSNPQALQCLHTFCHSCTLKLLSHNKVVCPTCRKETDKGNIVSDFKTNRLIQMYTELQKAAVVRPKSAISIETSGCEHQFEKCDLCEEKEAKFFCNKCQRNVCEICRRSHIKTTSCEEKDSEQLVDKLGKIVKELEEQTRQLRGQKIRFMQLRDDMVETNNSTTLECLQMLQAAEDKTIDTIRKHYKEQKDSVIKQRDERNHNTVTHCEGLVSVAEQMIEHIDEVKQSTSVLMAAHASLQKQISQELDKLKAESCTPLKITLINKNAEEAFDVSKAMSLETTVAVKCRASKMLSSGSICEVNGQLAALKSKAVTVAKLAEINDVEQLLVVDQQLWALKHNQINMLATGSTVQKAVKPGFRRAHDMCLSGMGHVIIASRDSGLLQLTTIGEIVRCLSKGSFKSVTYCDQRSIWAVKEEQERLWILKFKISSEKSELVARLQTNIKSGDFSAYCAILGANIYICHNNEHCVYEIDTSDGRILAKYGKHGKQGVGELDYPTTIYSDTHCLVVTDWRNHRLQILEPGANHWSMVKTEGFKLTFPRAAAFNHQDRVWISNSMSILYKGSH